MACERNSQKRAQSKPVLLDGAIEMYIDWTSRSDKPVLTKPAN